MNKKKIVIIYIVTLVLSALVPIGLQEFIFKNNIYSPLSNGEWASFFGSYIGGIVGAIATMTVFIWTVNDAKESREEEHRLQVIPSMIYSVENVRKIARGKKYDEILGSNPFPKYNLAFDLEIKNIGLGSAHELSLKKWVNNNRSDIIAPNMRALLNGGKTTYPIVLDFPDEEEYDQEVGLEIPFELKAQYKDIFGNLYLQEVPFEFYWIKYYPNNSQEREEKITVTVKNLKMAKYEKHTFLA